jgi:hypothetical protein
MPATDFAFSKRRSRAIPYPVNPCIPLKEIRERSISDIEGVAGRLTVDVLGNKPILVPSEADYDEHDETGD